MATAFLSDQMTKLAGFPPIAVQSNEFGGRGRFAWFSRTLPGSGLATGDSISLCILPKGARVIAGQFLWSATQGATATTAIGYAGATGAFFAAAVTASAAIFPFLVTQALLYGTQLTAATTVLATNAAAAWTVSTVIMGHVQYVTD